MVMGVCYLMVMVMGFYGYGHGHYIKKECNVITLQNYSIALKLHCVLHTYYAKLQILLHKTADRTTQNYTKLQTNYTYHKHPYT